MNEGVLSFFAVYQENWPDWGPQIYTAIGVTIKLTIASFALAAVLGLLLAVGKMSRLAFVRGFCVAYIEVARGVPALAVLFLLYFGLVPLGIVLPQAMPKAQRSAGVIHLYLTLSLSIMTRRVEQRKQRS